MQDVHYIDLTSKALVTPDAFSGARQIENTRAKVLPYGLGLVAALVAASFIPHLEIVGFLLAYFL